MTRPYGKQIKEKMNKRQLIITLTIGALAISGIILLVNHIYHYRYEGMRETNKIGTIMAYTGKKLEIKLDSNWTTGYQWQLAEPIDEKMIKFIKSEYISPNTNLAGAPGIEKWTFMALKSGKTKIALKYVRPWEKDNPPADRKEFTVVIR